MVDTQNTTHNTTATVLREVSGGGTLTHTAGQSEQLFARAGRRLEDGMGALLAAVQRRVAGTDGAAVQSCAVQIVLTVVDVLRMDTNGHHSH